MEEHSEILKDERTLASEIRFLDMLVKMREEPEEIDFHVFSIIKRLEKEIPIWREQNQETDRTSDPKLIIAPYLEYVYLVRYPNQFTLGKIHTPFLSSFCKEFADAMQLSEDAKYIFINQLGNLYRFLQSARYEANYLKIFRALERVGK